MGPGIDARRWSLACSCQGAARQRIYKFTQPRWQPYLMLTIVSTVQLARQMVQLTQTQTQTQAR
jgi:hypothetical protein